MPRVTRKNFSEAGNYAEAVSYGPRILTLDELLESCELDLDVWQVDTWGRKTYEQGAKIRHSDLMITAGVLTGWIKESGLGVSPLHSVWAKFIRCEPIAFYPTIRPVAVNFEYAAPEMVKSVTGVQRALIIADTQFGFAWDALAGGSLEPFHDRRVLEIALAIAEAEQPGIIIFDGDIFDFPEWQDHFLKLPEFERMTQPAICEANWWLRRFRVACPDKRIIMHGGNHDARMERAILKHLRAAYKIRPADEMHLPPSLSPERLIAADALGVEWVGGYPNDETWLTDDLKVIHGSLASNVPGTTAKAVVDAARTNVIFGHIHRKERASRTIYTRDAVYPITAVSIGCACRIDQVVPGQRKGQNWQQGIGVVDYGLDTPLFSLYDIEVRDGRAAWNGRIYEAGDVRPLLRRDIPDYAW